MRRSGLVSLVVLSGALILVVAFSQRGRVQVVDKRLDSLPKEIDGRTGFDDKFDDGVYKALNADENFLRRYAGPRRDIWLYIGYYGTRKGGRTGHLPEYCYPGSGWDIEELGKTDVVNGDGQRVDVNKILVRRGSYRSLALYWMHSNGHQVMNTGLKMNINRFMRRLKYNRDDGAFVRISARVQNDGDVQQCMADEKQFSEALLKLLPDHWPIEKEF